jgi:hypothetical protein
MIWEADTTVPPMYRGKALYSAGSPLTVVAFPVVFQKSSRIAPNNLSYKWFRDDEPMTSVSGLGRFSISFDGDQLKVTENISVDVYWGNTKVAHGQITIPVTDPQLLLYQRDPLRGVIYDLSLPSDISLTAKELTLQAEPYYFSMASQKAGALTYTWQLNDEDTTGPDTARGILTLRQAGSGQGEANLTVALQSYSTTSFIQSAQNALHIVFGAAGGSLLSNFFGL